FLTKFPSSSKLSIKKTRSALRDSLNTPGVMVASSSLLLSTSRNSAPFCVAHGVTKRLSKPMTKMTGNAKEMTGRIQLERLLPELNQTTISLSRYHRDKVSSTAKNKLRDSSIGKKRIRLKPNKVLMASLARLPPAATPM